MKHVWSPLYTFSVIDNYYETLTIYWPCRCGCSPDWEQCSINEIDPSIFSLHQYISKHFERYWYNDSKLRYLRLYFLCTCNLFQYIVHALCISQYIVCVSMMWQSIGYQLYCSIYWTYTAGLWYNISIHCNGTTHIVLQEANISWYIFE